MTKFRSFMDQRGFSQYRLHKLTGFTKTQISEWAHGKHRPSLASVRRLAVTLHLPIEDLREQLEVRERVQNARTPAGLFVPKSGKTNQNSSTSYETNDSSRTPEVVCWACGQDLTKAPSPKAITA
jgi:transcriptional regulator with XRE-family HTH domain